MTIENIKRTVANYYSIKLRDLEPTRRARSLVRPRQVAMALCKELTQHGLLEISEATASPSPTRRPSMRSQRVASRPNDPSTLAAAETERLGQSAPRASNWKRWGPYHEHRLTAGCLTAGSEIYK